MYVCVFCNGVARTLKKICTSRGDYWNKQYICSIASLFKMETSLKRKNSLPLGVNYVLLEQFLLVWKHTLTTLGDLP